MPNYLFPGSSNPHKTFKFSFKSRLYFVKLLKKDKGVFGGFGGLDRTALL